MKAWILVFGLCVAGVVQLQGQSVSGKVIDASSEEPLPYCHILVVRTGTGTITNEDGVFTLDNVLDDDVIEISYIGYSSLSIDGAALKQNTTVRLRPQSIALNELFIYANDDYLYSAIQECAEMMLKQPERTAKTYYYVATDIGGRPNELMESYYNGWVKGSSVRGIRLKNGRAGLPLDGNKFFFNLQTSVAIEWLETIQRSDRFPSTPFHYNERKMKRFYELQRLPQLSDTNTLHIAFTPVKKAGEHFAGEMWIDKHTRALQKLELTIDSSKIHPFITMGSSSRKGSRIENMSFDIVQSFRTDEKGTTLDYIKFQYDLDLANAKKKSDAKPWSLTSSCLMHFYEYDTSFVAPYFSYDRGIDDYQRISFIPYDSLFWANTHGYQFSEEQLRRLKYFEEDGFLLNYKTDVKYPTMKKPMGIMQKVNILWSGEDRVNFGPNRSRYAPGTAEFLADMFKVEVQIFLDPTEYGDQWAYKSATVLDVYRSYNYLTETPEKNCYVNIYFDLCEIARRKMVAELTSASQTRDSIDEIYKRHMRELNAVLEEFSEEVDLGMQVNKMVEWNALVKAELGIDNMDLFDLTKEEDN